MGRAFCVPPRTRLLMPRTASICRWSCLWPGTRWTRPYRKPISDLSIHIALPRRRSTASALRYPRKGLHPGMGLRRPTGLPLGRCPVASQHPALVRHGRSPQRHCSRNRLRWLHHRPQALLAHRPRRGRLRNALWRFRRADRRDRGCRAAPRQGVAPCKGCSPQGRNRQKPCGTKGVEGNSFTR